MPAIALRGDYTAEPVRGIAARARDADQARRLLSIAAVYDGMSRADAARIGGMDRQTLRDWVHRFNDTGPDGLINRKAPGATPKLTAEQVAELSRIVAAGPDPERDGVVRWRCLDLKGLIRERYGVDYHERSVGKLLAALGFAHVSARPRHLGQDPEALETFKKKTSRTAWRRS
jgi:transposase